MQAKLLFLDVSPIYDRALISLLSPLHFSSPFFMTALLGLSHSGHFCKNFTRTAFVTSFLQRITWNHLNYLAVSEVDRLYPPTMICSEAAS